MRSLLLVAVTAASACSGGDDVNHNAPETALDDIPAALTNQAHVRITFHALGNANGFVCALDGGAPSQCLSPFEADLADGDHTFAVSALLNSAVDLTPATHAWRVDATPPETSIELAPPALDNSAAPQFTFSGSDAGGGAITFECSLDGVPFTACSSPATVTAADGAHMFAVRAVDLAGNADGSPAIHTWTIDTTAPDTQILTGPAAGDTTAAAVSFTFSSPDPTATFECATDAAAFATCTSPVALTLADGAHTFAVRAKDATQIVDPSPAMRAWTVDAVAPTVTLTATPANPTNDATPTFGFSASETPVTFACQIDGANTFTACTPPWDGPAVTDGAKTFRVHATDAVGNVGAETTFSWVVDTAAPVVAFTSVPAAISNDATPTAAFSVTGGPASTTCQVDAGAPTACTSPFTSASLADGLHTITVVATDAAGNAGSATTAMFTIDTAAPVITIVTPATPTNDTTPTIMFSISEAATTLCKVDALAPVACAAPSFTPTLANGSHTITITATDAAANAAVPKSVTLTVDTVLPVITITAPTTPTNDTTPTIAFSISEPATATCTVDAAAPVACAPPSFTPTLAAGSHTITINATDTAGNAAVPKSTTLVVDTTPPVITLTPPTSPTNDTTPTITFSINEPATATCTVDTSAPVACAPPSFTPTLASGSHTITINATDTAGNAATPVSATLVIDTTVPVITIAAPASPTNDTTPTITFAISEPATATCAVDAGAAVACAPPSFTPTLTAGAHTITINATDTAGNAAAPKSTSVTIDLTSPVVAIVAPVSPTNDSTPTFTFSISEPATATCTVDSGAATPCAPPSFTTAVLADGSHTITINATDTAGNPGSASTTVVVDTTAPVITITTPTSPTADTTPTISFAISETATATCKVDAASAVACSPPSFTPTLAEGTHTITINATDTAGNAATPKSTSVTVDLTGPVITFTAVPASPSNNPMPTVTFSVSGGGGTLTCQVDTNAPTACTTATTFTTGPLSDAAHTITVAATDPLGNPGSATTAPFTIDTAAPTVAIDDAPPSTWPVNYYDMLFTSNDPGATFTCSLNGAAFTPCASPLTITTTYNTASSFRVIAKDAAGNQSAIASTSWTSVDGLVLHYPWEQGTTHNTSLLAQRPPYSPDGKVPTVPFVGGWAGTAAGSPPKYVHTVRTSSPLTSSANGQYTASVWIRAQDTSSGIVWTNASGDGTTVRLAGTTLFAEVSEAGGIVGTLQTSIPTNRWTNVTIRTPSGGKGIELLVNGLLVSSFPTAGRAFGPNQAGVLQVGPLAKTDIDDLRFYNRSVTTSTEMCTLVMRGEINVNGGCQPLMQGLELDLEGTFVNSGTWPVSVAQPTGGTSFVAGKLGQGLAITAQTFVGVSGYGPFANQLGHSYSLWTNQSGSAAGPVLDFTTSCPVGTPNPTCGLSVAYTDNTTLRIFAGTPLVARQVTLVVPQLPPPRLHNIVVTESRTGSTTDKILVYVDGTLQASLPFGAGDVFSNVSDTIQLPRFPNQFIDEVEIWPLDLSKNPEVLCENGFDGEWSPLAGTCLLTSQ